ncbi:MAG: cyanophycinase, partial [Clostridiales bacterium]|nr:cyanophycinase [Clostridiales bacterium]
CAGGPIAVVSTAHSDPDDAGNIYRAIFLALGAAHVEVAAVDSRDEANSDAIEQLIRRSAGVFFTGGDQLRITSLWGGTRALDALHAAFRGGALVAGTSAGASALTSTMVVGGPDDQPARKCTLKMAPGLGLLEQAIVDQHFAQRGRIGRLLCGVAENPHALGIGIDENTAVRVLPDARFEVLGENAVTVIDGRGIALTNASELAPDEILAIAGVTLHLLPRGYGFDMKRRRVLAPSDAAL